MNLKILKRDENMLKKKSSDQSKFFRRISLMCPISPISPMEIMRQMRQMRQMGHIGQIGLVRDAVDFAEKKFRKNYASQREVSISIFPSLSPSHFFASSFSHSSFSCVSLIISLLFIFIFSFSAFAQDKEKADQEFLKKAFRYQNPAGQYLANGGLMFYVIEEKKFSEKVSNLISKIDNYFNDSSNTYNMRAEMMDYKVFISTKSTPSLGAIITHGQLRLTNLYSSYNEDYPGIVYIPSGKIKGDWDLGYTAGHGKFENPPESAFHKIDYKNVDVYFEELYKYHNLLMVKEKEGKIQVVAYPPGIFDIPLNLIKQNPDDYYLRTLYYDSLIRQKKFPELEKDLDKHKEFYTTTDNEYFRAIYNRCRAAIRAEKLSVEKKNAWDFTKQFPLISISKKERQEILIKAINMPDYERGYDFLIDPIMGYYFLEYVQHSKINFTKSIFLMIAGKRNDALNLLTGNYFIGNYLCKNYDLYSHIIGENMKHDSLRGLEILAMNCCDTADEMTSFTKQLEKINSKNITYKKSREILSELNPVFDNEIRESEYSVRLTTLDTELQVLRLSWAAKKYFNEKKTFPKDEEYFKNVFKDNYPADPFSGGPIHYISGANEVIVYSVGPDNIDDKGSLAYDPTNGTMSFGDISFRVPTTREYPFSKEGLRADSKEEVEKVFSNGLPPDIFLDIHKRKLTVTDTKPVKIISVGPDARELEKDNPEKKYITEVNYDPTNGIQSRGDLILEILAKENGKEKKPQKKLK